MEMGPKPVGVLGGLLCHLQAPALPTADAALWEVWAGNAGLRVHHLGQLRRRHRELCPPAGAGAQTLLQWWPRAGQPGRGNWGWAGGFGGFGERRWGTSYEDLPPWATSWSSVGSVDHLGSVLHRTCKIFSRTFSETFSIRLLVETNPCPIFGWFCHTNVMTSANFLGTPKTEGRFVLQNLRFLQEFLLSRATCNSKCILVLRHLVSSIMVSSCPGKGKIRAFIQKGWCVSMVWDTLGHFWWLLYHRNPSFLPYRLLLEGASEDCLGWNFS